MEVATLLGSNQTSGSGAGMEMAAAINNQWGNGPDNSFAVPASKRGSTMQYWKKCERDGCQRHTDKRSGKMLERGWIIVGPSMGSDAPDHARYINSKHMTPLPQYGQMPYGEFGAANAYNRLRQILEHPQGIFEFPAEQMIAYGWDKIPEVVALRTDIAGHIRPICDYSGCFQRDFASSAQLEQHVKAVHPEAQGNESLARVLKNTQDPQAMASAMAAAMVAIGPQLAAAIKAEMERSYAPAGTARSQGRRRPVQESISGLDTLPSALEETDEPYDENE